MSYPEFAGRIAEICMQWEENKIGDATAIIRICALSSQIEYEQSQLTAQLEASIERIKQRHGGMFL